MARRNRNLVDLFDQAAPGANTDMLTDIVVSTQGLARVTYRVTCAFANATIVNAVERRSGKSDQTTSLFDGVALAAAARATFDILVSPGDSFNLQIATDGAIMRLVVDEVLAGGDA
jgi:hypothetical protein